jgi:hypothetical protein
VLFRQQSNFGVVTATAAGTNRGWFSLRWDFVLKLRTRQAGAHYIYGTQRESVPAPRPFQQNEKNAAHIEKSSGSAATLYTFVPQNTNSHG